MKNFLNKFFAILLITCSLYTLTPAVVSAGVNDRIQPDTWTCVDGLGRTISQYKDVGDVREDKYVGMFYWTWHYNSAGYPARNITEILEKYPESSHDWNHSAWENTASGTPYFWNEPLFGYYTNTDEYVVRKHAELLADAGVDVIFFDCTNATFTWPDGYKTLLKVFEEARNDGVNTPQIAFMLNFSAHDNTRVMLKSLWREIYGKDKYKDLWFMWEGKPLIMAHSASLDTTVNLETEILNFFTFRANEPSYFVSSTSYDEKRWGWCSVYPQGKYGIREDGSVEQMTVSVAQNANEYGLTNMNDIRGGVQGRSYSKDNYSYSFKYKNEKITINSENENAILYGLNFQQQWDYALEVDPDFIFITGWNEWIVSRFYENDKNVFVDQYTDEYSRDIEPTKGKLKDHYYYQLVDNIRKFKGVSKPEAGTAETNVNKTIDIFSSNDMWADILLEYKHYTGSTRERNSAGWGDLVYENNTMRNDIVTSKVAYDDEFIYFMVETVSDITSSGDPAWMRLLIDVDFTGISNNWEGFEYIINRISPEKNEAIIECNNGGWSWTECGRASFNVTGNRLQIAVPKSALGIKNDSKIPDFNFKWADNTIANNITEDSGNILDFYQYGDVAPGGRFMFSFSTDIQSYDIADDNTTSSSLPWYLYMAGGVVISCITIVVIYFLKTNKK
ncbi:MAG: hypothetical protein E7385_05935 [Ruminococcaceae bacterium]|nr:hypothetical protein [Oscillospiraceae bacterium]